MRFAQQMIDDLRANGNEDAAAQMEQANRDEDHNDRVVKFRTDATIGQKYPRMAAGLKAGEVELPRFASDQEAENYLQTQENFLAKMGAPLPGQQGQQEGQQQGQQEGQQQQGTQLDPTLLGTKPGMVPWSDQATQAVIAPSAGSEGLSQVTIIVADAAELMNPAEGTFRQGQGRQRDFQLLKALEIANRMTGGTQQIRAMRLEFMDADAFPV